MSRRTYAQYCALARALDVLGERWTLLVVRDLLVGPKRFSDLLDGLPGIGPNALSARLKSLEADGLVTRRRLPRPAASTVYELTERGSALDPVVRELARWGIDLLGAPAPDDRFRPAWLVTAMRTLFEPGSAAGVHRAYRLQVDDDVFAVWIDDGAIEVRQGDHGEVDLSLVTDADTVLAIASGDLSPEAAIGDGLIAVERGDPAEALALVQMFRLPRADVTMAASRSATNVPAGSPSTSSTARSRRSRAPA